MIEEDFFASIACGDLKAEEFWIGGPIKNAHLVEAAHYEKNIIELFDRLGGKIAADYLMRR